MSIKSTVHAAAAFLLSLLHVAALPAAEPGISGRVVGPDGKGIAQAVVFVQSPDDAGTAPATAPQRPTMDQVNKTFVPGVLPVVVGTEVRFPNHDQIHHHVYSFSRTKSFELPLYKGHDAPAVLFDKPGVVKVGCNIHDWMSGIILVLPNSHFAVTDADGKFTMSGLPAGAHALVAWHELSRGKLEDTTQRVQVPAEATELTFTLALSPARNRPALRGLRKDP